MSVDSLFLDLIRTCTSGEKVQTRNSTCYRTVAPSVRFTSTPLVSVRKTAWKSAIREWEWFLSGSSYLSDLHESVRDWWSPWVNSDGYVSGNYGEQLLSYSGVDPRTFEVTLFDQIKWLVEAIRNHPNSRRNVITTWNPYEMQLDSTPITNCHGTVIQTFVERGKLSLSMYQRSCDVICGLPHNWIQYWAFLLWLGTQTGYEVGTFYWLGGDVHVYEEHLELAWKMNEQKQFPITPNLVHNQTSATRDLFRADDFTLDGPYQPLITDRAVMVV